MPNYALIDWIKRNQESRSEAAIKEDLLNKGWKKQEVETALDIVYRGGDPDKKKSGAKKWCCISGVVVILLIIAAVVALFVYGSRVVREQAEEIARQAERNKIVGGSEVWHEEVETKEYDATGRYTYTNEGPATMTKIEGTMALAQNVAGYQEIVSEEITPADYEIITDDLGNKYAKFVIERDIAPGDKYEFKVVYRVKVRAFKNHLGACEGEQISDFLGAEKYIESDNEEMKKLAAEITVGKTNDCEKAEAIYSYVGDNMEYVKSTKEERGGALEALEKGKGDCTYFADYYIALARAAGIPTRFLEGATYATKKEEQETAPTNKHDWAESYLPGTGWTPVDPTWGEKEGNRSKHFSQTDGKHIVLTRGRNLETLKGGHYLRTFHWYKGEQKPKTSLDDEWTVELAE